MAQHGRVSETEALSHVLTLVEAFRAFDADNDGLITPAELGGVMSSLGCALKDEDLQAMGSERGGPVSLEEFLEANTNGMELGGLSASSRSAFEAMSANGAVGDRAVTAEELYATMVSSGMEALSLEDCENIVATMDADGDGAISFEDLKLIVDALL